MDARGGEEGGCEAYWRTRRIVQDTVEAREAGVDGAIAT
jgi:hypothetical protein